LKANRLNGFLILLFMLLALPGFSPAQTIEQLYQASLYVKRGDQYKNMNLWDKAANEYWNAVELDYKNIDARGGLGAVYQQKGQFNRAIENYQIVLSQRPDSVEIQYRIALCYYYNHQYTLARDAADKAQSLDQNFSSADNLIRFIEADSTARTVINDSLRQKEVIALQSFRQLQERKEGAFIGKLIPGWRLIQTAETRNMWTGYAILGSTAAMMLGGYMLRSSGQKAFTEALEATSRQVFANRADLGQRRYKYGGYMIDAAMGMVVLNMLDSFLFKGKIFGGRTRVKPTLPERERHKLY